MKKETTSRLEYRVLVYMRLTKEETDAIATLLLSDSRVAGLMITPNEVPTIVDEETGDHK